MFMIESEFKRGPVDVEQVVNDSINASGEDDVRDSVWAGSLEWFESAGRVAGLLS